MANKVKPPRALLRHLAPAVNGILHSLEGLDDGDALREGLQETPDRVARYLQDITRGSNPQDMAALLKSFTDGAEKYDEMVFEGGIPFYSLCEHHMAPFFGAIHIGYIPQGRIVGLSKLARLVDLVCAQLQVQERIAVQIADTLVDELKPEGVGVVIQGRHLCMESRGVRKTGIVTTTSALRGSFKEAHEVRAEFMGFVHKAGRGAL